MVTLPTLLATGGLVLDVIGAAVIALPDIPRIRLVLGTAVKKKDSKEWKVQASKQERLDMTPSRWFLNKKYDVEFPDSAWAMRVGQSTASRYGFEAVFLFTDPNDESEQMALGEDFGLDVDYRAVKKQLQSSLDRTQALIRGIGFLLLSSGFILQIVARFV